MSYFENYVIPEKNGALNRTMLIYLLEINLRPDSSIVEVPGGTFQYKLYSSFVTSPHRRVIECDHTR